MHAAPGVYGVLAGSGLSRTAGVPTSWDVVQDLIRRVACADGATAEQVGDSPEAWWAAQGRPELRYDTLLAALAPTDAARQGILRGYFDPVPGGDVPLVPSAAHTALGELCASGRVRVIVTTNFDRLIERALDAAGVSPQVISSPTAVAGMIPLVHAPVTVVKLHGDYTTLGLRNTPTELGEYPAEWKSLLAQLFDEYGLIVVGWSAEYDTALAEVMRSTPSRRYPMYWASHRGSLTESAQRLVAIRSATIIDTQGADEFLSDIVERLKRLDSIASRQRNPRLLRSYAHPPEQTTAPPGWAVLPLLQLRVVGVVGPASIDRCGLLRPAHRKALVDAMRLASVTTCLFGFASVPPANATAEQSSVAKPEPLVEWKPTPEAHQSTDTASYRLGGDASSGVSALVGVRFPNLNVGGAVAFTLDIGLSIERRLLLGEVARLLRAGLLLVTDVLPDVFADALPRDSEPLRAEVHLLAAATDGKGLNRPNDFLDRVDFSQLGQATRAVGPLLGSAASISGRLTERDASEVVAEAIEYMALAYGYLDPELGVALLRQELGVGGR